MDNAGTIELEDVRQSDEDRTYTLVLPTWEHGATNSDGLAELIGHTDQKQTFDDLNAAIEAGQMRVN